MFELFYTSVTIILAIAGFFFLIWYYIFGEFSILFIGTPYCNEDPTDKLIDTMLLFIILAIFVLIWPVGIPFAILGYACHKMRRKVEKIKAAKKKTFPPISPSFVCTKIKKENNS